MKYFHIALFSTAFLACSAPNDPSGGSRAASAKTVDDESWFWGNLRDATQDAKELAQFFQGAIPEHPEVVMLLSESRGRCTGTLARTKDHDSRRVIVTAAHCVDTSKPKYAYFGKGTPHDVYTPDLGASIDYVAHLPIALQLPLSAIPLSSSSFGPEGFPDLSDVALMILPMDVPDSIPRSVISPKAPAPPQSCKATGYGNRNGQAWWQRSINLTLDAVRPFNLLESSQKTTDDTQITGPGDSGGPFWCDVDGETLQVGVLSGGTVTSDRSSGVASGTAIHARLDIVHDLIDKAIQVVEEGGGEEELKKLTDPNATPPASSTTP